MKQILIFLTLLVCGGVLVQAQDKNKIKKVPKAPKSVPVYLANQYDMGSVPVATFNSILPKGFTARDSAGKKYDVTGFAFTYVERNLYEDSVGNLIIVPDYLVEYCFGDTLSRYLLYNITNRAKWGDTVYVDKIKLKSKEGYELSGASLKLVLTK